MPRPIQRILLVLLALSFSLAASALDEQEELVFFARLMDDGLHGLASAEMESFLQRNPTHPERSELLWKLERCYLEMGRPASAMERARSFALAAPEDPRACSALFDAAHAGAQAGMLGESSSLLEILLRDHEGCEDYGEAVLLSARIRRAEDERAAAHQLLGWLIDNSSDPELLGRALYERAQLRAEEDPETARPDYLALKSNLADHPLAGFASLSLARLEHEEARPDRALAELEWLLARFGQRDLVGPALSLKADWLEEIGRPIQAAAALEDLRRRFPDRADEVDLTLREGRLLREGDRRAQALALVEEGLARHPDDPRLLLEQAPLVEAAGRPAEARDIWRRVIALNPDGPYGLNAAARLFEGLLEQDPRGEVPGLAEMLLAGLADASDRAECLLDLGLYYRDSERSGPAERSWEAIEAEDDRSAVFQESLYLRALLAEREGRWAEAETLLDRLQREFGGSAWGRQARDRLDAMQRFSRVDLESSVERLLSILQEDLPEPERSFGVGHVLAEGLKDFPRAAEHFEGLAANLANPALAAEARLEAGLAASREASRLALDGESPEVASWRTRALRLLAAAQSGAPMALQERIALERTLLEAEQIPEPVDRLPLLELFLERWPESPLAWEIHFLRGEILRNLSEGGGGEGSLASFRAALAGGPPPERVFAVRLALAQAAQDAENWDLARQQYQILLDEGGPRYEGVEARYGLGELAEREKRYGEALGHFEAYLEMAPGSPRVPRGLIHLGDCHFFLAEWSAAMDAYGRLWREWEDNPFADDAVFRWSLSAERLDSRQDLLQGLSWLVENGSERFRREAHWRLSKLHAEDGKRAEQESALRALLDMGWTGRYALDAGLALGELLLDAERGVEAGQLCDSLLAAGQPGEEGPLIEARRIRALLLQGRGEEAQLAWDALNQSSPPPESESAEVLLAFGRWHGDQGRPGEAQRWFALCLERHGGSAAAAEVAYENALLEAKDGRLLRALELFDEVIENYPDTEAARESAMRAAGIYYNRGDHAEASARFERAYVLTDRPDPELLYFSALALEKAGEPRAALERIQLLLIEYPEDERVPEAMMKVGYFLQQLGQYDRALLAYRNADFFQDREGKARLHFWIADCLEAAGDLEEAGPAFLKVNYLYADQGMWGVTAGLRAAMVYEKLGDVDQARILYEKVIGSQGDNDFGRSARQGLERLEGGVDGPQG